MTLTKDNETLCHLDQEVLFVFATPIFSVLNTVEKLRYTMYMVLNTLKMFQMVWFICFVYRMNVKWNGSDVANVSRKESIYTLYTYKL